MTPSEIVAYGFERSPVVMMNEAHNGMSRCPRTRRVGREVLPAAHAVGCRHIAMEAIPTAGDGPQLLRSPPEIGYLAQPEMRELVEAAVGLGWTFVAYEIGYRDDALTMVATNRRELVQAENLVAAWQQIEAPMLVWCGNSHHAKRSAMEWTPMGVRFVEVASVEHFAIDQTMTISFGGTRRPNLELTGDLRATLDALGGTAGFVSDDPPPGLEVPDHHDALILSTDNEMIGDPPGSTPQLQ